MAIGSRYDASPGGSSKEFGICPIAVYVLPSGWSAVVTVCVLGRQAPAGRGSSPTRSTGGRLRPPAPAGDSNLRLNLRRASHPTATLLTRPSSSKLPEGVTP